MIYSKQRYIPRMKIAAAALLLGASLVVPATSHADCGEPEQPACTGSVPAVDQVLDDMAELTNPSIPAINKGNVVTPGFSPEEAATVDDHLNRTNAAGLLPYPFVVTDIVSAPANFAGVTVTAMGTFNQQSAPQYIVLFDRGGHWLITHDAAWAMLDHFWSNANRHRPVVVGGI